MPSTLERVFAYLRTSSWPEAEILVVDDGSTDGTAQAAAHFPVRVLSNPGNRGKGYSVRHGMLEAAGDWLLFTDADLSAPIEELEKLWQAVQSAHAAIAIGSRALDRSLIGVHQSAAREQIGRFFNVVMRLITALPFRDTQCGFKLFQRRAARDVFSRQLLDGFGFDVEVLFLARALGYPAVEVPVRWNHAPGTKVSLLNGLQAFLDPLRVRRNHWLGRYKQPHAGKPFAA